MREIHCVFTVFYNVWFLFAGGHLTGGTDVVPYNGPTPPIGTHRYFVALFQQSGPDLTVSAPQSRCRFDVDSFAAQYSLTRKTDIVFKVSVRNCLPGSSQPFHCAAAAYSVLLLHPPLDRGADHPCSTLTLSRRAQAP